METIELAVRALERGEVIGLPTETVYGLAGDATNPSAVRRIFALKGRPAEHPLIVHLGSTDWLDSWAREVPSGARELAARFWPGPMTLILPKRGIVLDLVTGGQDTVGLRVPSHPVAQAVLQDFGRGIAAPSANRFGRLSPTRAAHVREEFGAEVPIVLDGGACDVGIESTIVDLSTSTPRILRPGRITADAIESVLGRVAAGAAPTSPRAPGTLASHYAPRTRTEVLPRDEIAPRALSLERAGERVLVLAIGGLPDRTEGLALPSKADEYAKELYAALRALDARGARRLLVELPPEERSWTAIRDRLTRASVPTEPDGS